jgi:hypothetical protein
MNRQSVNSIFNDPINKSSIACLSPMPGGDLGAPAAAFELGVDVAAQQANKGARPLTHGPRSFQGAVRVDQVKLAGGSAVEAMHRSSVSDPYLTQTM